MAGQRRDLRRERFWRRELKAWARSGESIRSFCTARGLRESAFHAWRRTITQRDDERVAGQGSGRHPSPSFIPVTVVDGRNGHGPPAIEIEHRSGAVIRISAGTERDLLVTVLAALDGAAC